MPEQMRSAADAFVQGIKEYLARRDDFILADFGMCGSRELLAVEIEAIFLDTYSHPNVLDTPEELLLNPREACIFCDEIRRRYHCYDLPDRAILLMLTRIE